MTYFLNLRAQAVGGDVAADVGAWRDDTPIFDPSDIAELAAGKDVLLATHGFNVDEAHGRAALSGWEGLLSLPGMQYIAVLWPGDSSWALGADYPVEGNAAMESAKLLASFMDAYLAGARSISFASHSLGARLVLETVCRTACKLGRAVLMAGAIDDNCLANEYAQAAEKLESISILASKSDWVLEYAFPPGNVLGGIFTKDSPYWRGALGRYGPKGAPPQDADIIPGWQIPDDWLYRHHSYLPKDALPAKIDPFEDFPDDDAPVPGTFPDATSAWSAAFVSRRLRR